MHKTQFFDDIKHIFTVLISNFFSLALEEDVKIGNLYKYYARKEKV